MDRLLPGIVALIVGSVLAVLLIVPFVAISYRRRGGLTPGRTLAWLALLLWVLGLWAYTLLPLPSGEFACAGMELDPLQGFRDALDPATRAAAVPQLVLNVALFVPWGFLVRALWRRGWLVAGASGLLLSLGVELTQLTGVWGAYPCAYRLFDTGDLLTNTTGAVAGSLLAIPFLRHGEMPLPAGLGRITLPRRLVGMLCDVLVTLVTSLVTAIAVNAVQLYVIEVPSGGLDSTLSSAIGAGVAFLGIGALVLATGTTPGEAAVRLEGVDGRRPALVWRGVRYLAGIGGLQVLLALPWSGTWWAAAAFALVTVVVAARTTDHRGLATLASGMNVRIGGQPITSAPDAR